MSYNPPKGTIPYRVIEFLKLQQSGSSYSSAELAEAIGHEGANISVYLKAAIEHGAITVERRAAKGCATIKLNYFSLGDGVPLPKPEDDDEEYDTTPPAPAPQMSTKPTFTQRPATQSRNLVFGYFSDGTLVIRQPDGQEILLSQEETKSLVKFLENQVG